VRSCDALPDGPRPHLVLEAHEGPRLSTLIRRFGPLPPEQLLPLGLGLCSALAFMHDSGYLHLRLKPRNTIMGSGDDALIDITNRSSSGVGVPLTPEPQMSQA